MQTLRSCLRSLQHFRLSTSNGPGPLHSIPIRHYWRGKENSRLSVTLNQRVNEPSLPLRYNPLIVQFLGNLMKHGKLARAEKQLFATFDYLHRITSEDPYKLFANAVAKASPVVLTRSIKSTRIKTLIVPRALTQRQSFRRGMRWIIECSKKRPEKILHVRLANEMLGVLAGSSEVIKKKQLVYRQAVANRVNVTKPLGKRKLR